MSKFKLALGMQVVESLNAYKGTDKEFRVCTWCGDDEGWNEQYCKKEDLDSMKELSLWYATEGQYQYE